MTTDVAAVALLGVLVTAALVVRHRRNRWRNDPPILPVGIGSSFTAVPFDPPRIGGAADSITDDDALPSPLPETTSSEATEPATIPLTPEPSADAVLNDKPHNPSWEIERLNEEARRWRDRPGSRGNHNGGKASSKKKRKKRQPNPKPASDAPQA